MRNLSRNIKYSLLESSKVIVIDNVTHAELSTSFYLKSIFLYRNFNLFSLISYAFLSFCIKNLSCNNFLCINIFNQRIVGLAYCVTCVTEFWTSKSGHPFLNRKFYRTHWNDDPFKVLTYFNILIHEWILFFPQGN